MNSTNLTSDNNGTVSRNVLHGPFSIVVASLTFISVAISFVILITIKRGKSTNFFQWRVVDRFTVYTTVCDLLFYAIQILYDIHLGINDGYTPSRIACKVYGVVTLEFGLSQIMLTVATAIFAFFLVYRNYHLSLGRYDMLLHTPVFGLPLTVLVIAAILDQIQPSVTYCGFKEERGILTWHFLLLAMVMTSSFVAIFALYLFMWCFVRRESQQIKTVLQQRSAVKANALALKLSMFVLVHVIQFGIHNIESFWMSFEDPPIAVRKCAIVASVIGGILNGVVYFKIRKT